MTNATILDEKVQIHLEHLHIEAQVLECDPAFAHSAAFCEHYGYQTDQAANTILVASRVEPVSYAACIVLATTKLDVNRTVCKLMGVRKASFASAEQTIAITGMMIGGVTALGLPDNIPIYIDSRVMHCEQVVMGGGNRSSKLVLKPQELLKLSSAQVIEGLAVVR